MVGGQTTTNQSSNGSGSGHSEHCGASGADGPTLLELFTDSPEFKAFAKQLRHACQVLTVADFMKLRKHYEAAWQDTLAEL